MSFLGIPLSLLALPALALAIVWLRFWPRDRAVRTGSPSYLILRWFHALTWFLLAFAALIAGLDILGGSASASSVALLALGVYVIFMVTLLTSKRA